MASCYTSTASDGAWNTWVSTTSTTSNTTDVVWATWCSGTTTATTTNCTNSAANVYRIWVTGVSGQAANDYYAPVRREPTAAERAAQRKAAQEAEQRQAAEAARKKAASKRALELLLEHLTAKQREDLKNRKFFLVQGGKTGKQYRIRDTGRASGNIDEMADNDNEKVAARLCAHAPYHFDIPNADQLLGQMLMLKFEEEEMLRIANRTPMAA